MERHHELMGFDRAKYRNLLGYYAPNMYSAMGGVNAEFVPGCCSSVAFAARRKYQHRNDTEKRSVLLQAGPDRRQNRKQTELITRVMRTGGSQYLIYSVVVGDPESARLHGRMANSVWPPPSSTTTVCRPSGHSLLQALKTEAGRDKTAPGAPTDVKVYYKDGKAVVFWSARRAATPDWYQVSYRRCRRRYGKPGRRLADTGSPTPSPPAATLDFKTGRLEAPLRLSMAWDPGTYDPALDGRGIIAGTLVFVLFDSNYMHITPPSKVAGYTLAESPLL